MNPSGNTVTYSATSADCGFTGQPALKVLHIEAGKHLYGGALQVAYLTDGLTKMGVECFVACPKGAHIIPALNDAVTPLPMIMQGDLDLGMVGRLRHSIKSIRPDIVHIHSRRGADTFGLLAAKLCKVPVVISRRVDNTEASWIAKLKYHSADKVITISDGIRQVLLSQGVSADHVLTVRSAIDTNKYRPKTSSEWFTNTFDVDAAQLAIGVIAQLIPRKGHSILFQALTKLRATQANFRVLIFGRGPDFERLQQEAMKLRLTDVVEFVGFREDLHNILPHLDLVVHPAFNEGLGVSLLQASSCGVPILASRIGGIPEAVVEGETGWLVSPGDVDELAGKLQQLKQNPSLLSRIAERARKYALAHFSVENMVQGNIDVYKSVLKRS